MGLWRADLFHDAATADCRPLVACSACLLGEAVRYDGGHRELTLLQDTLPHLQLQAICPEVGIGLGVPRQTLKVIDADFGPRVVQVEAPHTDVTDALLDYADSYCRRIGQYWPLTAYIFKARSPSCGVGSSPVNPGEPDERVGDGLFAGRIRTWAPWLSLYQEEELDTPQACLELMFLCFICLDIVWQGGSNLETRAAHYARLFELSKLGNCGDTESLWREVRLNWQGRQLGERRELLESFRAT